MPLYHRSEIAEIPGANVGLAQLDFGDCYCAPCFCLGDRFAGLIEDG